MTTPCPDDDCAKHKLPFQYICLAQACTQRKLCRKCFQTHNLPHNQYIVSIEDLKTGCYLEDLDTCTGEIDTKRANFQQSFHLIEDHVDKAFQNIEFAIAQAKTDYKKHLKTYLNGYVDLLNQDYTRMTKFKDDYLEKTEEINQNIDHNDYDLEKFTAFYHKMYEYMPPAGKHYKDISPSKVHENNFIAEINNFENVIEASVNKSVRSFKEVMEKSAAPKVNNPLPVQKAPVLIINNNDDDMKLEATLEDHGQASPEVGGPGGYFGYRNEESSQELPMPKPLPKEKPLKNAYDPIGPINNGGNNKPGVNNNKVRVLSSKDQDLEIEQSQIQDDYHHDYGDMSSQASLDLPMPKVHPREVKKSPRANPRLFDESESQDNNLDVYTPVGDQDFDYALRVTDARINTQFGQIYPEDHSKPFPEKNYLDMLDPNRRKVNKSPAVVNNKAPRSRKNSDDMDEEFKVDEPLNKKDAKIGIENLTQIQTVETGHDLMFQGGLAAIPCKNLIVTGGSEGSIVLWDLNSFKKINTVKTAHDGGVIKIKYSAVFDALITTGNDHRIKLWSLKGNNPMVQADFKGHKERIFDFDVIPDKKLIISGDQEGHLKIWDPFKDEKQDLHLKVIISSVLYVAREQTVFVGKSNGEIANYAVTARGSLNNEPRNTVIGAHKKGIPCMVWCDAKELLITGGQDAFIKIWEWKAGRLDHKSDCKIGNESIRSLILVGDDYVLSTNGSKKLRVWNTNNGSHLSNIDGPDNNGGALCYIKEKTYVVGVFNNKLGVWMDLKD
jgi:hypothetical protein